MIFAEEATEFTAVLWNRETGMASTLTVGIFDPSSASYVVDPTNAPVTESPAGSGVYLATLTCPPVLPNARTYLVLWDDPVMEAVAEELTPLAGPSAESPTSLPNLSDVGALLRARTKNLNGVETGTFTSDTRPTDVQVVQLMTIASDEVYAELGKYSSLPASVQSMARRLVALRTAMLVELSFFPEQVRSDKSAYTQLSDLYEKSLPRLREATIEIGQDGEQSAGQALAPSFSFPEDAGGMISWGTDW